MVVSNFLSAFATSQVRSRYTVLAGTFLAGVAGLLSFAWIGSLTTSKSTIQVSLADEQAFNLSYFAGSWRVSGNLIKDEQNPPVKVSGTSEVSSSGDGTLLEETIKLDLGDASHEENKSSITYLRDQEKLVLKTVSSNGGLFETFASAPAGARELVFTESITDGSSTSRTRLVVKIIDADTYVSTVLYRTESGDERQAVTLKYSRATA